MEIDTPVGALRLNLIGTLLTRMASSSSLVLIAFGGLQFFIIISSSATVSSVLAVPVFIAIFHTRCLDDDERCATYSNVFVIVYL